MEGEHRRRRYRGVEPGSREVLAVSERLAWDLRATWLNIDIIPSGGKYYITEFSPVWHPRCLQGETELRVTRTTTTSMSPSKSP